MKPIRESLIGGGLLLAAFMLLLLVAERISPEAGGGAVAAVVPDSSGSRFVMRGASGTTLLVKPVSTAEYEELTTLLYPNGVVDEQGQAIDGIANMEAVRAAYIAGHTKAFSYAAEAQTEVPLTPFSVCLEAQSSGFFDALMYRCTIGTDTFIFPSEWGRQPFGFAYVSEAGVYLAYTDVGIWRIDARSGSTTRLTGDIFAGQFRTDMTRSRMDSDSPLLWIDNVVLSPTGRYVVYRTNRDAAGAATSVWRIDLRNPTEIRIAAPAYSNDIVGFLSDSSLVLGALDGTSVVNVVSSSARPVALPALPNLCLRGAGYGTLVYTTHSEDSAITTAYVSRIDDRTGQVQPLASIEGCLDGVPHFSPSGEKIAFLYGADPSPGTGGVCIVDADTGALLPEAAGDAGNAISGVQWLDDNTIYTYDIA